MGDVKFDLHPWELRLSAINLKGEVDFELEMGGELCQVRRAHTSSSSCPYFRFLDAPEEHFLLANFHASAPHLRCEPLAYSNEKFSEVIEQSFQSSFELHTWGRYFWLRQDLSYIQNTSEIPESVWNIFLLANGQGTLISFRGSGGISKGMSWNSVVPFQWHESPSPEILRARTNSQWIEWLQSEMDKPESSVRFARDFAALSGEEARLRFTSWQHGNLKEWKEVMHWILQSENSAWRGEGRVYWAWPLSEEDASEEMKHGTLSHFDSHGHRSDSDSRDTHVLGRLRIASRYFSPSLDVALIKRRLKIEYSQHPQHYGVRVAAPTAHERLEAALSLRAWAQGKFPAHEIEILCGLSG